MFKKQIIFLLAVVIVVSFTVGCSVNTEDETIVTGDQTSDIDLNNFVLIEEGIYEPNKSLFEYEKFSVMNVSEWEEGILKEASDWYILPETFGDYDNDGKKMLSF